MCDLTGISQSYILFTGKEYGRALKILNKVKTKKIELLISVKILLLRIYYELNMFIEAYMILDTLRYLLPKAETIYFSPVVYQENKNFLKHYSTLIKAHEKDQPEKKFFLLNELNLRKLEREFRTIMNETRKLFASFPPNNMHYFFDKAMLEDNIYFYNSWISGSKRGSIETDEISLKSIIDNFTRFYLIASITMYRKVLYIKNYRKIDIDLKFTEQIMRILEHSLDDFTDIPIIGLYANEVF